MVGVLEGAELGLPAEQRRVLTAQHRFSVPDGDEPVGRDGLILALQHQGLDRLDLDRVSYEAIGRLADQNLERGRRLLEPRRDVDRIADDQALLGARVPRHHLTGVDAGSVGKPHAIRAFELVVQAAQAVSHLRRGPNGAQGVVLVQPRQAEYGHDRVADVLLDPTAVALEDAAHHLEVARHHLAQGLGVEPLAHARRALEIGEDDRDGLAHLARRRRGRERRAAEAAEAELVGILLPAAGTDLHELSLGAGSDRPVRSRAPGVLVRAGSHPVRSSASRRQPLTRTEFTGARRVAAANQLDPPSDEPNTSPDVAPK